MDIQILLIILSIVATLFLGAVSNWLYDLLRVRGFFSDRPTLVRVVVIISLCFLISLPPILLTVLSEIAGQGQRLLGALASPVPLWLLLSASALMAIVGYVIGRKFISIAPTAPMVYDKPGLVTASNPGSEAPIPSRILEEQSGGISVWVYMHPFGQGIRHLKGYRHVIAHDTNSGWTRQFEEGQTAYVNVFSLARGPEENPDPPPRNPEWRLWIENDVGELWVARYSDTQQSAVGWHHFLVRWDHDLPLLELLIDGAIVVSRSDYRKCWPKRFSDYLLFGTWTNRAEVHYIETYLWRAQALYDFPDNNWVAQECKRTPPEVSNA